MSRAAIDIQLDALETSLPALIREYPDDGDFWMAFAGAADVIEDNASSDDAAHVRSRITAMLGAHGLIPSDNDDEVDKNAAAVD